MHSIHICQSQGSEVANMILYRLPEEWETVKITMRGLTWSFTEEHMIATIRDEDNIHRRRTKSQKAKAPYAPPKRRSKKGNSSTSDRHALYCTYCDKDGHTTSKCWNKPPYYYPRCKIQGHTLQNCSEKGKKKAKLWGKTSKGKGKNAKHKRREEEEDEKLGKVVWWC